MSSLRAVIEKHPEILCAKMADGCDAGSTFELSVLLPCPFCGKIPEVYPKNPEREGDVWGAVQCFNSNCPAQPRVDDGEPSSDERGSDKYKEAAIRRWNIRASNG